MKPEIIVVGKIFAPTQEKLDREFTCHKLYEAPDRDAFLKQHAGKVRAPRHVRRRTAPTRR